MAGEGGVNLGTATGYIEIKDNVDAAVRQAQGAFDRAISNMTGSMQRFGDTLTGIGAKMLLITAPLMLGLKQGVGSALQFEESITNVAAVLGLTADETAALSARLLEMGGQTRAGPQAIADAYYDIAGGVADASTHMAILEAAIAASEAGNADLGGTTNALIAVMNSYGLSADQAAMVSDVLTRTVGAGVGTMDEFGQALGLTAGIAAANGVELDALGGSLAYITTQGVSASEAGTQVTAIISAMLNPNERMKEAFKELGWESGQAALEMYGLAGVTGRLENAFGQDALAPMLGNLNALRGATALNQAGFEEFIGTFEDMVAGSTDAARAIQNMSRKAKIDKFRAQIEQLAITFGESLFPAIDTAINALTPFIDAMIKWVSENPEIVSQIALLVAAIAGIGTVAVTVGVVISALGGLLAVLLSPIGMLIGGLAALAMAWQNNVLGIQTFATNLRDGVLDIAQRIASAISGVDFSSTAQTVSDGIADAFNSLAAMDMTEVVAWLDENLNEISTTAVNLASVIFGGPAGAALGVAGLVKTALENDFLGLGTFIEESGIRQAVEDAFNVVKGIIEDVINALFGGGGEGSEGSATSPLLGRIAQDVSSALGLVRDVAQTIGEGLGEGIRALGDGIKSFAESITGISADDFYTFIRPFAGVLGGIITAGAGLAGGVLELGLKGLGEAFKLLGEGINQLVTGGAALINGDIQGALDAIGVPGVAIGLGLAAGGITLLSAAFTALSGAATAVLSTNLGKFGVVMVLLGMTDFDGIKEGVAGIAAAINGGDQEGLAAGLERLVASTPPGYIYDNIVTPLLQTVGIQLPDLSGLINLWTVDIPNAAGALGTAIGTDLKNRIDIAKQDIARILGQIETAFNTAFKWIEDNVITPFKDAIQSIIDKIAEVLEGLGNLPGFTEGSSDRNRRAFDNLMEGREFASGGYTGDGPANEVAGVVHRGEFVLSQDMLRAIAGGGGIGGGRKVAENINIYANSRDEGYAAAMGFEEEVGFALRS